MTEKRSGRPSVAVEIAGERHVLRSDAPAEYTRKVAEHVDSTIRSLGVGNTIDPHRAAILAAMIITDELFRANEEISGLREELIRRADRLAAMLEKVAEPDDEGG